MHIDVIWFFERVFDIQRLRPLQFLRIRIWNLGKLTLCFHLGSSMKRWSRAFERAFFTQANAAWGMKIDLERCERRSMICKRVPAQFFDSFISELFDSILPLVMVASGNGDDVAQVESRPHRFLAVGRFLYDHLAGRRCLSNHFGNR